MRNGTQVSWLAALLAVGLAVACTSDLPTAPRDRGPNIGVAVPFASEDESTAAESDSASALGSSIDAGDVDEGADSPKVFAQ